MSRVLVECVPNFSEGRRTEVIEAIVAPLRSRKDCFVFDYRADEDHNRLVVSLAGDPSAIQDALLKASRVAIENIDMNRHEGAHPRIGAVDVVPFTPVRGISMEECVELSRSFGKAFNEETGVPVYFYEDSALIPERKKLEVIRRGQYEGLKEEISLPHRKPDVGEASLHPTAGATVIGARRFLVAFNVNLGTSDMEVARSIARAVRASSGGLCNVKGIGVALEDRNMVQVSMNIVDHEKNPLYRVLELVRMEARRWGVQVVETEVYGMIPAKAILDSAAYYLQTAGFVPEQVLELKLLGMDQEEDQ
jgi:glutamate formiminotransferase